MFIKEIQSRAGSLTGTVGYVFLLFTWYLILNVYRSFSPLYPDSWLETFLYWLATLVISPVIVAVIYAGIHHRQQTGEPWSVGGVFDALKSFSLRAMAANFSFFIFFATSMFILLVTGIASFDDTPNSLFWQNLLATTYSALTLFWLAGIIVDRKLFSGLFRAIKVIFTYLPAFLLCLLWGGMAFAEASTFDQMTTPVALSLNVLDAAIMSLLKVVSIVYALAIYKQAYRIAEHQTVDEMSPESTGKKTGDGLLNTGIGFALASFIPLVHLVALALGLVAIFRQKRVGLRSLLTCAMGGFFTIFYGFILLASLLKTPATFDPGYSFLVNADPSLRPVVALMDEGSYLEAINQLSPSSAGEAWAHDTALAISQYQAGDVEASFSTFSAVAQQTPPQSEFYYYYGLSLLDNGNEDGALRQFDLALTYEPKLEQAQRYHDLLSSQYEPPFAITALLSIIILIVSFAIHEYGHALIAWKSGDDTAEQQGRLTPNPIQHLDLFGSIILPAILIFQQSPVVFGWAKPVPVDSRNFKNPRRDHVRVAFAGPAMNLLLAMVLFLVMASLLLFIRIAWPDTLSLHLADPFSPVAMVGPPSARAFVVVIVFIKQALFTSLVLGFLNLIPLPPLDGSWILSGLLPEHISLVFERMRGVASILFLVLIFTSALDYMLALPFGIAAIIIQIFTSAMGFG